MQCDTVLISTDADASFTYCLSVSKAAAGSWQYTFLSYGAVGLHMRRDHLQDTCLGVPYLFVLIDVCKHCLAFVHSCRPHMCRANLAALRRGDVCVAQAADNIIISPCCSRLGGYTLAHACASTALALHRDRSITPPSFTQHGLCTEADGGGGAKFLVPA
jgi:hypothetical protein